MTTAANDNRPPEFDALIEQYTPGLKRLAGKLAPGQGDELYVDTVILLLHRWRSFRVDGGFWNWASLTMRGLARENRNRAKRQLSFAPLEAAYSIGTPPVQQSRVELNETVAKLRRVRGGADVLRYAMGDTFADIGKRRGVSIERARQIVVAARERVAA